MIARLTPHYDDRVLQELLEENLPDEQTEQIQTHLSDCPQCRQILERLAGSDQWWDETVNVLSESHSPETLTNPNLSDTMVDWLGPILEPAQEGMGNLDRYAVTEVIGQGGMGVVLRGFDGELNRPVAIKVLAPHLAGVGAARARFMREAQAAAAIVHPSIVPIYSVVTTSRLPYLVMPLVEGGNLQQQIDQVGALELADVLRIGCEVAEGLAAAHRRGVIHRDIKPSNLLIEEGNGRILISDFGLARALDDATITRSGMIAGTPQYMSPEQSLGEPLDERSDLFSLGSLLYALSTGRPPFRAEKPLAVLKKITEGDPKPIHQINERMPPWWNRLVAQLMTKTVEHRISTAQEAATLLREAHAHVCNPSAHPLPKSLVKDRSNHRIYAVFAVFGLILGGAAMWTAFSDPPPRSGPHNTTSHSPSPAINDAPNSSDETTSIGRINSDSTSSHTTNTDTSHANLIRWDHGNQLDSTLKSLDQDIGLLEQELGFIHPIPDDVPLTTPSKETLHDISID